MPKKKLWGGRFKRPADAGFEAFSKSIDYDCKLALYDILYSKWHVVVLCEAKILSGAEAGKLTRALASIERQVKQGTFRHSASSEDIHTEIHNRVAKKVGSLAAKLHSLRSRNDQIAFDEKYYCIIEAGTIAQLLTEVTTSLLFLKKRYGNEHFIGYTHLQRAQVIRFGDYTDAYFHMFIRDVKRLKSFVAHIVPRLGSGALAGTAIPRTAYVAALRKWFKKTHPGVKSFDPEDFVA